MPRQITIPCDELRRLYEDEHLGTVAIAQRYGCSATTISLHLRKCNILARPSRFQPHTVSPEELRRLYLEEKLPIREIARRLGISVSTFNNRRRALNISRRKRRSNPPIQANEAVEEKD